MLQFKIKRLWEPDNDDNDLNHTSLGAQNFRQKVYVEMIPTPFVCLSHVYVLIREGCEKMALSPFSLFICFRIYGIHLNWDFKV